MNDYTKLVEDLRGKFIAYDVTGNHNSAQLYKDAADAIEKLVTLYEKAEMDATNLTGKLTQAEAQLPKRGEWKCSYPEIEPNPMFMYGICSICGFEQSISNKLNYCPNCGAKMEVQE